MEGITQDNRRTTAACAYVENEAGEVLLVRTAIRPDTWEMPGGRVEAGESLVDAVRREVLEETGIAVEPETLVGLYENVALGILVAVFRARRVDGVLRPQPGEILEVAFVPLAPGGTPPDRVTREQARIRITDARRHGGAAVHEAYTPGGARRRLAPAAAASAAGGAVAHLRALQAAAWENKLAKGFNVSDVALEFGLLSGEVAEAFRAWREGQGVGDELADVAIYTAALAEMLGVDLASAVEAKVECNARRLYRRLPNGTLVKGADATAGPDGDGSGSGPV